ncbi:carbamoyl-phosphate synthase large subunit [Dialister histaminiformans]|uniref:Carbamoyl phosphate synthase large chain n=2 Tax=Allisonella TaxID=209879 RepID=A0A1G5VDE7_9FIRM|nr:carbamoyl-phosphate synthase large subunit [Allisonella histaminiformans]SDA43869.1 carbamoyl-phosphate synthase large subunit [Allisonella histaminiformans]
MKRTDVKKVLVIGSGPIVIGQAAEFDYAGTQACRSLREEGMQVVLVNSNPSTIMTDSDIADAVYIEPITLQFVTEVIKKERPDALLATLGGQVGLNMAVQLAEAGVLEKYGVKLLGSSLHAIKHAEDRELFKEAMEKIHQPVPESEIFEELEPAVRFADSIGYPVIIRPAFTLGGTGGGIAHDRYEMEEIANRGLKLSPINQILVERSVAGWKEVEYEVMRDSADNCIIVCSMENIDPVGVHTGDSIVVAPTQTLTDGQFQMLRTASINIIRYLGIEGGCNVQYALDTRSNQYYVIEVNPRVSRSSALASKATGYPIAKVAAKVALGMTLDEITNAVTGDTKACFEPSIDYVVCKFPRWPFEKFTLADRQIGTQMKATGEVMALDRTLEGSLLKAIRSLEVGEGYLHLAKLDSQSLYDIRCLLHRTDNERIFVVAEALRRGIEPEEINRITRIDLFFLYKIQNIIHMEKRLIKEGLTEETLVAAKKIQIPDKVIAKLSDTTIKAVRAMKKKLNFHPDFKMVDTCAAEFEAKTPYYYSTYGSEDEVQPQGNKSVVVFGSGPIRIGQGIEFDYCSVHASWALRKAGHKAIVINNNPETVSTDFDTSDALYFEPLTVDDVMEVIEKEKPEGVICQFGGQTAINLATPMAKRGIRIIGSSNESIDMAEDRERFDTLMGQLGIARPKGCLVESEAEAIEKTQDLDYPLIVRPSYVLGGRAMQIVYDEHELRTYLKEAVVASHEHPVLIDQYMVGREVEIDAISDGIDVCIPGIMEQIERSGVHSGDSFAVYPPQHLSQEIIDTLADYTKKIAIAMSVKGLVNIQFIVVNDRVYVIEVNPRASRTVPFMSKITGINMVEYATRIALGESLKDTGLPLGLVPPKDYVAIKAPVFSFSKLGLVEIKLGPEMKSTGEVMGIGHTYEEALYKAVIAANLMIPAGGSILITVSDRDKKETANLARGFVKLGYKLVCTSGTGSYFKSLGIPVEIIKKIHEKGENCEKYLKSGKVDMVLNTISYGSQIEQEGYDLRRIAVELAIPCLTSLDTAKEVLRVMAEDDTEASHHVESIQEYVKE